MGIKHLSIFLKNHFASQMYEVRKGDKLSDLEIEIDNLMIDMNGVFHNSAQKVYQYGNHKPQTRRLLGRGKPPQVDESVKQIEMFAYVCSTIDNIVSIVNPQKKLILCVDGCAPIAKQCIVAGSKISMGSGLSCKIEDIFSGDKVWGWDATCSSFTSENNLGLQIKGAKKTVKITLVDGSTLECTPDHQILVYVEEESDDHKKGINTFSTVWKPANSLTQKDKIIAGIENPLDITYNDEMDWSLAAGNEHVFDMVIKKNRENTLKLARLIGYITAHGYMYYDIESNINNCTINFSSYLDASLFVSEIYDITDEEADIYSGKSCQVDDFSVILPKKFVYMLSTIPGISVGNFTHTTKFTIPDFILDKKCPKAIAREFLAGILGSSICEGLDYHTTLTDWQSDFLISPLVIEINEDLHSTIDVPTLYNLITLLKRFDISTTNNLSTNCEKSVFYVMINSLTEFASSIGFRYNHAKSMKLTVASSYYNLCHNVKKQNDEITNLTLSLLDITKISDIHSTKTIEKNIKETLNTSINEYKKNNTILDKASIPSVDWVYKKSKSHFSSSPLKISASETSAFTPTKASAQASISSYTKRINLKDYLTDVNALKIYKKDIDEDMDKYRDEKIDTTTLYVTSLPFFTKGVLSVENNGITPVYDIEVVNNHSFIANGICVHNCQQRQRRFRSANDSSSEKMPFETSSITPGTKFMDKLTKYVDWYIREKLSTDSKWQSSSFEVIFSNEKAPGEGEQKCITYIRKYGNPTESYCINGLDADLIMLALGTHIPRFYVLREDLYNAHNEFHCIDTGGMREVLDELMFWESDTYDYSKKSVIDDFIFMCFIVGNDFVPHIPSIEIIQNGIELMMDIYKQVGASYGHLTEMKEDSLVFRPGALKVFMGTLGNREKQNFENKLKKKDSFFTDEILNSCASQNESGMWNVDICKYNRVYHQEKFGDTTDLCRLAHSYIEGMQWVLTYYTKGVPNWNWFFPYYYAPTASVLAKHIDTYIQPVYEHTEPNTPFQQLLCVLPPACAHLIPKPLCDLITSKDSPLKRFYPDTIKVDLAGKRKEWEGIVVLPMVDTGMVKQEYFKYIEFVDKAERERDIIGKSFVYSYDSNHVYSFPSTYGTIENCKAKNIVIDI